MYNENITYQNLCISKKIYSSKCLYWKISKVKKQTNYYLKFYLQRKSIVNPK